MLKPLITISDWNNGSSLSERIGAKGQNTIEVNTTPTRRKGYLSANNGWTKCTLSSSTDLGTIIYDVIKTKIDANIYVCGDDTKIYYLTGYQVLNLAHDSSQSGTVTNMAEYENFLYYGQGASIGRKDLATAETLDWTDNWQTSSISATYQPMEISGNAQLYIGNGRYLANWDNTTFNPMALDLSPSWDIICLANFGIPYIAIGANSGTNSKVFLWDRISPSWNDEISIPETQIFAMKSQPGGLWILAGSNDVSIYYCPLGSRQAIKVFTFNNDNPQDNYFYVNPNAITVNNGRIYFSLSINATSGSSVMPETILPALYSFEPDINNLKIRVEYDYTSIGSGTKIYNSFCVRSFIGFVNTILFHSIDRGTTENLIRDNMVDGDTVATDGSYIETLTFEAPPGNKFYFDGFGLDYRLNSGSETYTLSYKKDAETSYTQIKSSSTSGLFGFYQPLTIECRNIKFKIYISGSDTFPYVSRFYATGKLIADSQ